ncbi:hypothetical protein C1645_743266 [Glomus cerebriforme]|uniref:Uncharacterized protein n=1 Tax=Glomus cerebriforme TaxID=658196 RepID=A0A397SKT3_9GLOM|nr:hypothetical protein C1645_743266 [Glomus cerebriforme]
MYENYRGFITEYKKITGKKRANITDDIREDFQTARINDRMNQKSDIYADWNSEVDKASSSGQSEITSQNRHQKDEESQDHIYDDLETNDLLSEADNESNDHDCDEDKFSVKDRKILSNRENGQGLPEIDEGILEYINTFSKDSTKEIRKAITVPHPRSGDDYNPQKDFVFEHIKTTVSDWVRLLEMQPNPLTLEMPEAWYRINVWRTIDIAFSDIPYTYVVGGEKAGLACTERKNRYRTLANIGPTQRKAVGDAYIRTIGSTSTDWVASEAGPKWQGAHGTKIQFEEQKMRKLNVIGFVHAGAVLIRVNLDCPAGYVCRYMRRNPLEVYADGKSLDVLVEIIHAKLLILQTMKVVNDPADSNSNVTRWKQQTKLKSKRPLDTIPDVHPTPKKRKDKEVKDGVGKGREG